LSELPIDLKAVLAARNRIRQHIRATPLEPSFWLSESIGYPIRFKLENWQKTGSFKIRGALNKLLSMTKDDRQQGVVTASAGNHGLGVAFASELLDVTAKIVVPETASPAKIKALSNFNVELIQCGVDYDAAEEHAHKLQGRMGGTFVHAFSDPDIIAGQGTVGLEIVEEWPDVQTILVPMGGGGLIAGVATAAKGLNAQIKVVGVQSEASPAMYRSLKADKVVETPIDPTIADGLAGRFVTDLTLNYVKKYVDDVVLVSEPSIKSAMKLILEREHCLVEGSAAVGVAALMENIVSLAGPAACVITGSNLDFLLLKNLL
jgi:threonine dehydratase